MNDIFQAASRQKLRFDTSKGPIAVEDLWDLPLSSQTGKPNLDAIAISLDAKLKTTSNVSFVDKARKSDPSTQLAFDVVKSIIDIKIIESEAASKAREIANKKQQILSIINQKEDQKLSEASIDDLRTMLANM